ncbi:MAG: histone deacetylase family protein [Lentisphaerae bacterium]|nr:histone deacetylase family protein [Lentisphaerota bacterium]
MLRIHRVYSTALPADRDRVAQVQVIFRDNFAAVATYADKIPDLLNRPFEFGYRSVLFVSENASGSVTGFSLFLHLPEINSSLLDFVAIRKGIRGGGLGGALYSATREYLREMGSRGLYMEVFPDSPLVKDPAVLAQNRRRIRFYESHGARIITGTDFETPIDEDPAAHLMFDSLGREDPLRRAEARAAFRLILTRKYSKLVAPDYIERVVESVVDDPVRVLEPRRSKKTRTDAVPTVHAEKAFALVSSPAHALHHVREQGYVERPARVDSLCEALAPLPFFESRPLVHFPDKHIKAVHAPDFVTYLHDVCLKLNSKRPVYPYVFPIRRPEKRPKDLAVRAGYYCIDTFTPLDRNAYDAARAAVDTALSAARLVVDGRRVAYAICRPPGHHAERRAFGGFCYFNNAAIAAHYLSTLGRVATLDIDYHHGNGTQDIFYQRADVLTVSVHGHPNIAYPYFSGFADERGDGDGVGYNRNYPLSETITEVQYLATFDRALATVRRYDPTFLVVSIGFDIMKGDPTGTFPLTAGSMREIGRRLVSMALPTLVVQEGGYRLNNLRSGAPAFFKGLYECVERGGPVHKTTQRRGRTSSHRWSSASQ